MDRKIKILIVDDDPAVRETLQELCTQVSEMIYQAADGASALEVIRACPPDLVILDQNMPGMKGTDVLTTLRLSENRVPVIMLTGEKSPQIYRSAWAHEIFDYFQKPFNPDFLLQSVKTATEQKKI